MRLVTVFGFVLAAALGLYMYSWQMQKMASAAGAPGGSPQGLIDSVAVKADLMEMAGAEQQQLALEGKYLSFEDLRKKGVTMPEGRGPYTYTVDLSAGSFVIKATPKAAEGQTPGPTMTIGPDMKVKREGPAAAADDAAGDPAGDSK
jgi:hypothetical protein